MRRFEVVSSWRERGVALPQRKTCHSAGYDLAAAERVVLKPHVVTQVPTGLKAYMQPDEVLKLYIRSSLAIHSKLALANGIAIIDADYVDNPQNEGHIILPLVNWSEAPLIIEKGERVAQGIFSKYLTTNLDEAQGVREGGFGSTGK